MAKLITIYWRDIPSQIVAKSGRRSAKVRLANRFQDAIDRAAMRAGKGSSDAYLSEWRRDSRNCSDDLEAEAQAAGKNLYRQAYLEAAGVGDLRISVSGGTDPVSRPAEATQPPA